VASADASKLNAAELSPSDLAGVKPAATTRLTTRSQLANVSLSQVKVGEAGRPGLIGRAHTAALSLNGFGDKPGHAKTPSSLSKPDRRPVLGPHTKEIITIREVKSW
jgi:hypothetical protein